MNKTHAERDGDDKGEEMIREGKYCSSERTREGKKRWKGNINRIREEGELRRRVNEKQ